MNAPSPLLKRREFQTLSLGLLFMGMARINSASERDLPVDGRALQAANNRFAWNFLKTLESMKPGENQFVSPFSIESALLMTMEGARNKTALEMGNTLGLSSDLAESETPEQWRLEGIRNEMSQVLQLFQSDPPAVVAEKRKQLNDLRGQLEDQSRKARELVQARKFAEVGKLQEKGAELANKINRLSESVDSFELRIANGIWADKNSSFEPAFIETVQKHYHAEIKNVDFQNAHETQRKLINDWVSDKTEKKISDLIPAGAVDAMTRMVLANAIYFRGTWAEPFNESSTKPSDFYLQGTTKVSTPMMNSFCEEARYGAFRSDASLHTTPRTMRRGEIPKDAYPSDGFQVLEMLYNGGELSMIILLPIQRDGLAAMIRSMTSEKIDSCLEQLEGRNVQVSIPKFTLESKYDLRHALESMGMVSPFDYKSAEFPGMSSEPLMISKVLHKTFVEVNEKGTEAAAATAVVMAPRSAAPSQEVPFIPRFVSDHPFLFLIRHNPTGIHLFLGKMENPLSKTEE